MAQEKQFIRQTRRPIYLLEGAGLPRPSGSRAIAADVHQPESAIGRLPRRALGQGRPSFQEEYNEKFPHRSRGRNLCAFAAVFCGTEPAFR